MDKSAFLRSMEEAVVPGVARPAASSGMAAVAIASNIVSPLGFTTRANYEAVRQGCSGLKRQCGTWGLPEPFMASLICREAVLAECENEGISGSFTFFERMAMLSVLKTVRQCEVDVTSDRTLLILSTTKGNVDMLRTPVEGVGEERLLLGEAARAIAGGLGLASRPVVVSCACISGVSAQIEASRLLAAGRYDYVIVCGIDVLSPFIVSGFQSLKALTDEPCRPFDEDRTGINLGDAAATIIYKGVAADQQPRGSWAMVRSAIRNDAFHISSPSRQGEGSYRALRLVLQGEPLDDIAFVSAHGTATLFNDEMESVAIDRAGLSQTPVNSLKGYYGHTMGAAGVLESILSMEAVDDGVILPTRGFETLGVSRRINVVAKEEHTDKKAFVKMMSGFGGCNAAILFRKND